MVVFHVWNQAQCLSISLNGSDFIQTFYILSFIMRPNKKFICLKMYETLGKCNSLINLINDLRDCYCWVLCLHCNRSDIPATHSHLKSTNPNPIRKVNIYRKYNKKIILIKRHKLNKLQLVHVIILINAYDKYKNILFY